MDKYMFPYLPHTDEDISEMLKQVGIHSVDDLFADIPEDVKLKKPLNIPGGATEYEVSKEISALSKKNITEYISFMGCGSYDHIIPSVVKHIISRSEFYTSYTPYQAEFSQGFLQAIFEFQTMICELTSLDVSNASLYDGHTAACEAAVVALNSVRKSDCILYSETIHPFTKQVLRTHFSSMGISLREIKQQEGITSYKDLKSKLNPGIAGVIVQTPNFMGYLEDYTGFADLIHDNRSLFIISSNPLSLGSVKSQGQWGADVAVGDTQPLGLPSYFGGPSVGYIAATKALLRKMPGRIVGQSLDREGGRAFILTLQAREQHIKRERATSNICSNQALAALATTVYLAAVGKKGLEAVSRQNVQKSHYLFERLTSELPVQGLYEQPFFNEFPIKFNKKPADILGGMEKEGVFAGIPLQRFYPDKGELENVIGVAVTEKRTRRELDNYVEILKGLCDG